jgi:hypothetical protein
MRKHIIAARFGSDDMPLIDRRNEEAITYLDLLIREDQLDFGIASMLGELNDLNIFPSEIGLDLLLLATHVYAADTRISRDTESQDNWTREITLIVPVSEVDRWNMAQTLLQRQLNFLTGDIWTVQFRARHGSATSLVPSRGSSPDPVHDTLSLFSGGMDSLIGAIDALAVGKKPLLISHAGDGATSGAQHELFECLETNFPDALFDHLRLWLNIPTDLITGVNIENTTRARSFLFFALGILAGTGLNKRFVLQAPENGYIALNVPLDTLRLGALSTRTTHPFYMDCWNKLLMILNIDGKVDNPYWNKTKGEMASECQNIDLLKELIPISLSCSSPAKARWKGKASEHCGYCLPCLVRRAAIKQAFGQRGDRTEYTLQSLNGQLLDSEKSEGLQIRSFQLAIKRLQNNPSLAKVLIHKPGPLPDASRNAELADVYLRGISELGSLLANVRAKSQ